MEIMNFILRAVLVLVSLYQLSTRTIAFISRKRSQTLFKLVLVYIVWGSIGLLSVFPGLSFTISETFGLGENLNTLTFLGFFIVFLIIFRILRTVETLESTITDLVQKDALRNIIKTSGEKTEDSSHRPDLQRKG
jgi:hypothetical protein